MKEKKLGFELGRTSRHIKRYMDSDASKNYVEKMTGTHGWALGFFHRNMQKNIFQKDFEKEFDIRRSTASNILSLMEEKGLITRESVPYDARLKKIVLTQKSIEINQVVTDAFDRMEKRIMKDISDEELQVFFAVLDKINNNLERNDTENAQTSL